MFGVVLLGDKKAGRRYFMHARFKGDIDYWFFDEGAQVAYFRIKGQPARESSALPKMLLERAAKGILLEFFP